MSIKSTRPASLPEQQYYSSYALKASPPILRGHRAAVAAEGARDQVAPDEYSEMLSRAKDAY